jgi:transcriptional regulator with XRE-family HTH domain
MKEVVGRNVKALRQHKHQRNQAWLAERLQAQGQDWTQSTVSQVELGARHVNVDELFALAAALEVAPLALLRPYGVAA